MTSREFISNTNSPLIIYPLVPFPQRLKNNKIDNQFSKFLSIFKLLHINIPLVEALEKIPKYAKFFKDILSNNQKLEDHDKVMLTEESSVIL